MVNRVNILQRYYQLPILGTLDMSGNFHQKGLCQLVETLIFICMQKINFIYNFFFEILERHCKFTILGTLGMLDHPIKIIASICSKLSCLSACKKSTSFSRFFWRYCKDMQTSYFGHFGHAWPHTSKMTASILRNLWSCLSTGKKSKGT